MYAVVYKNKVIVGPMSWNRGIFQGSLEKYGITDTIPRVAPEELPYIINEDAKIMLVEEVRPEMDPMVEYYYGPLWTITEDRAVANFEVHDSPVESAKVNYRNQAADQRWIKETQGTEVTIQGVTVTVPTDRASRDLFLQRTSVMGDNEVINWKFPEAWISLTKQDLVAISSAILTKVQGSFDWEKSIVDQVNAAETKEQLQAIVILEPSENAESEID
jgi:hypothetical protein